MTRYYDNNGGLRHEDATADIEEAKRILEEKNLCIAIVEGGGKTMKVQRGQYNGMVLIHCGKAYFV